jgi:hypothetical protein
MPSLTWRWWLSAIEVRLRFVVLVLVILGVVTQWSRLRNWFDNWRIALHGQARLATVSGDTEFFCPMDPGISSQWPAICPICNMDLVSRKKHDAQLLPDGVIARMQLAPYRIQLAGLKTEPVECRDLTYRIPVSGVLSPKPGSNDLEFRAPLSPDDRDLLQMPRDVLLSLRGDSSRTQRGRAELAAAGPTPFAVITLPVGEEFTAGVLAEGAIEIPAAEMDTPTSTEPQSPLVAIPESAVVDHGSRQLVFVETMPGMFDAVEVQLGRRCGNDYPVRSGLKPGQRVVTHGAFLLDAETRLNPSLAVAYFGANQARSEAQPSRFQLAAQKGDKPALSSEDLKLAAAQAVCPVTNLPLDSMGGPLKVTVGDHTVFICCEGCRGKLEREPETYLKKLHHHD